MTGVNDLAKLVPGFEFLQGLMKNAGAALPGMGQWVAPTLNPEEIEKRIQELKTVQFWLDSNAKLLGATIQALEVQRMTLSTLQTMNLPLADLGEALKIKLPDVTAPSMFSPRTTAPAAAPKPAPEPEPATPAARKAGGDDAAPAAIDPMRWWSALTQQFAELASRAVQDSDAGQATAGSAAGTRAAAKRGATTTAGTAAKKASASRKRR